MSKVSNEVRDRVVKYIGQGLTNDQIKAKVKGIPTQAVAAYRAHITMGTYGAVRQNSKALPKSNVVGGGILQLLNNIERSVQEIRSKLS